jgi:Tol biopolymer transport system component
MIAVFTAVDATRHMHEYSQEPGRRFEQIATANTSLFACFPAISRQGLFYQAMSGDGYVLRWLHDDRAEEIPADGDAFYPTALPDGSIDFELVSRGISRIMNFDPATRTTAPALIHVGVGEIDAAVSPDGKWVAFTSEKTGPMHLWLRNVGTGKEMLLAGGSCNSSWPAWEIDSQFVVFASDCGRAFGLPGLYRAQVSPSGR